jgi:hypothetical protein
VTPPSNLSPQRQADEHLRPASCQCGHLSAECCGDPVRVSVCHCLACQKRSGGPFGAQARFARQNVTLSGESKAWTRTGDEGNTLEQHFCPQCGSTLWYTVSSQPDIIAIPIGAFADPSFPSPEFSVYEDRQHNWVQLVGDNIEHYD